MSKLIECVIDLFNAAATGRKRRPSLLTFLVGSAFFCIVLLLIIGFLYLDRFLGLPEFMAKPYRMIFSLPVLIGGAFLWIWCAAKFFKTKGTPVPVHPPPRLITEGPYAYSRNPMLAGIFAVMAGIGIFLGSIMLTFIMTPRFVLMSILEFKYVEEPELEKRFGEAYTGYKEKTPMIIPRIRRH